MLLIFEMDQEQLFYSLALQKVTGIGAITARRLVEYFGTEKAVFKAAKKELIEAGRISETLIKNLSNRTVFELAETEMKHIKQNNITVIHYKDERFPELLNHCPDAPILLFSNTLNCNWNTDKIISIVGTRQPTTRGLDFCAELLEGLKDYNPVVVSGLAYGVDISAHLAALNNNVITYAVLGHGLNKIYPDEHFHYAKNMEKGGGGLLSEFWITDKIDRENFIKRNRIVAGMTKATIVIESALKGGSMSTISFANDYNRDAFAVPGRVQDRMSAGCNELIRTNRAQLLTSAKEIIETLNWDCAPVKQKQIQPKLFLDLNEEEQKIYDFLKIRKKELLDVIAIDCAMPIYKVSTALLNLELKGAVAPLPGKYFEIVE
ncbi:DNA-processing protein DprA [Myroides indicus]|nr:DNA-processing protein DprA [Myroides indicus]